MQTFPLHLIGQMLPRGRPKEIPESTVLFNYFTVWKFTLDNFH